MLNIAKIITGMPRIIQPPPDIISVPINATNPPTSRKLMPTVVEMKCFRLSENNPAASPKPKATKFHIPAKRT